TDYAGDLVLGLGRGVGDDEEGDEHETSGEPGKHGRAPFGWDMGHGDGTWPETIPILVVRVVSCPSSVVDTRLPGLSSNLHAESPRLLCKSGDCEERIR